MYLNKYKSWKAGEAWLIIVKGKVRGKARPRKGKHGFYTPADTKKYE